MIALIIIGALVVASSVLQLLLPSIIARRVK